MNKIIRRATVLTALVTGFTGAYLAGYAGGSVPMTDGPAPGAVNVSIVYEESGEARTVSLTDSEGLDIPVGSVAEEFPHLEHDYSEED